MKAWKIVLISLAVIVLLVAIIGGIVIGSIVYPQPLVSGEGDRRIVCVGDSITYAQGVMGSREKDSFTAILSTLVEDSCS